MHHGNEEKLPETESKCSLRQGQRSVQVPDVGLLPVHRGRFRVVSPPVPPPPRSDIFTWLHPTFDQFQEAAGTKQEPIRFAL